MPIEKIKRIAKKISAAFSKPLVSPETLERLNTLSALTGSGKSALAIMDKCGEISTHFTTPNNEVFKECFDLSYRFLSVGLTTDEVIAKLEFFDNGRLTLLRYWGYAVQNHYSYNFTLFVYSLISGE